jgi:hypothetical protein
LFLFVYRPTIDLQDLEFFDQITAMTSCLIDYGPSADYILFSDTDEFLVMHSNALEWSPPPPPGAADADVAAAADAAAGVSGGEDMASGGGVMVAGKNWVSKRGRIGAGDSGSWGGGGGGGGGSSGDGSGGAIGAWLDKIDRKYGDSTGSGGAGRYEAFMFCAGLHFQEGKDTVVSGTKCEAQCSQRGREMDKWIGE